MREAIGQEEAFFSVRAYGATGNGKTVNTGPFQHAIDECSRSGGGVVHVPQGRFVIGTVELRTGVTLELSPGAVLMGSTNISDYRTDTHHNMYAGEPHMDRCLIFARGATNIGIRGTGVIDGCTDVHVSNCTIDTSDDSICLQTSRPDKPCRNLVITNCSFASRWAGIRVGLLSRGDFRDVVVSNCIFRDIEDSGLKIQMCKGATMRNLLFSNPVMDNVPRPVFMSLSSQRACVDAPEGPPAFEMVGDIVFSTIRIAANGDAPRSADHCIVLSGYPGHPLKNIFIRGITYTSPGGILR